MFKRIKFLIALSMVFTFTPLMKITAENSVEVTTADEMINALKNQNSHIYVVGTLEGAIKHENHGGDPDYTVYTIEHAVTIEGAPESKVQGTFMVKSNNVTIKNLSIKNKGDIDGDQKPSPQHRGNIVVYAENVKIYNNNITNNLGSGSGLANAIQIFSNVEGNSLSSYDISNNTIEGFNNEARKSNSVAIIAAEGYKSTIIGGHLAQKIEAEKADYEKMLMENTFLDNTSDIEHIDWPTMLYKRQATALHYEYAENAVKQAEDSKNQEDVDTALLLVGKLSEGNQTDFIGRLDVVQTEIDKVKALENSEIAVSKAEKSEDQNDVDLALALVKELPEADQEKLLNRLKTVQSKIDEKEVDKDEEEEVVLEVITDKTTGIMVETVGDTVLPEGVELVVSEELKTLDESMLNKFTLNVKEKTNGKEIIKLYNISLLLNKESIQPNGKVKVTLPIDEDLKGYENLEVTYIDENGKITVIESEIKDGKITFETDHFSYYAVIGNQTKVVNEVTDVPKTAVDSSNYYYIVLAIVSMGVLLVAKKKKRFE